MAELKPCPFCGGEARLRRYGSGLADDAFSVVECESCGASGQLFREISFDPKDDEQKAIKAWNRRVDNG